MSILRVANLQFNASGTKRIDYDAVADDGIIKISAEAVRFPVGSNGTRPPSEPGLIRYNSDVGYMEFGGPTKWIQVASNSVYDVANASYAATNVAYNASNAAYTQSNTVNTFAYGIAANAAAAFAAANNVGPQIAPAFNQANAAYASINSNWTVTNTVYGAANAAFGVANTALQNTSGISFNGNFYVPNGNLGIGTNSPSYKLHVANGSMAVTSSTGAGQISITDDSDSGRGLLLKSNHSGTSNTYVGTNSSIKNLIFGIDSIERMRLDTSGNFNVIGNISGNFPTLFQSSTQATTSSDRSLGYSTSWTDHLSVTFTATKAGPIYAGMVLAMTYESAAVQGEAQFVLSGAASKTSQYMAVAQQSDANRARGAHSMTWLFGNCPAGSYTLTLQVRNNGSGSTWILNNYLGFDTLYCSYM